MKIRKIPIGKIKPAKYNPRKDLKPGDRDYESIKKSIKHFGLVEPLVWNERTGNLVGGHQRFKVLTREMKPKAVEVVVVDLDRLQEKMLNLALNKIAGKWEKGKLQETLRELKAGKLDVSLGGFQPLETEAILETDEEGGGADPDVVFSEELGEANNYIVLAFNTDTDFLQAKTLFGLDSVYSRRRNGKPWAKGVGRVLKGAEALERLRKSLAA